MKAQSTIEEFQKGQALRVWDMIFVAPVLIYAGLSKSNLHQGLRFSLFAIGVATFVYNANNYFKNDELFKQYQKYNQQ
jgi:hypothetical protein